MRNRRKSIKQLGMFIDVTNIILGIAMIIIAITMVITAGEIRILFPIIFLIESVINLLAGIKAFKSNELKRAIALLIATLFMIAVTVVAFMIVL